MNPIQNPTVTRALAVTAAALALTFAGCDRNPSTGTVDGRDRISEDRRAAERAPGEIARGTEQPGRTAADTQAVKGVDDAALTAKVKSALIAEPTLSQSLGIEVNAAGGEVILKGVASSNSDREKAVQIASSVEGVKSVRSDLKVVSGS